MVIERVVEVEVAETPEPEDYLHHNLNTLDPKAVAAVVCVVAATVCAVVVQVADNISQSLHLIPAIQEAQGDSIRYLYLKDR